MSELPGHNENERGVSVEELECYLNGLQNRLEAKSAFAILKISFSRLKIQDLDAREILKGMLRFFEAAQPENIQQNEIYIELLNLYNELFPYSAAEDRPTAMPASAGYASQIYNRPVAGVSSVRADLMKPTIKPPEFAGGPLRASTGLPETGDKERSEAETMRPPEQPDSTIAETMPPPQEPASMIAVEPEGNDEPGDDADEADTNSRKTMPDIDRKELALMLEMLAKERRLRTIFALDDDAGVTKPAAKAEPAPAAKTERAGDGSEIPQIETGETDLTDLELPEEEDSR